MNLLGMRVDATAATHPDRPAHIFLDRNGASSVLTYFELSLRLLERAEAISVLPPGPVVLAHRPGHAFIVDFLAALSVGRVVAPAPWGREISAAARRSAIAAAIGAAHVFSGDPGAPGTVPVRTGLRDLPKDAAIIQFSSGSTKAPRGIVITHDNIAANMEQIRRGFSHPEGLRLASWLPPFHDMGLFGGLLQPFWMQGTAIQMAPETFLRRPDLWLRTISEHRATTSGAPSFGYDHACRRISEGDVESLADEIDLACWDVAFCGAERVRADILDEFGQRMGPLGFDAKSFLPCYGLAEATLFVSGRTPHSGLGPVRFDKAHLSQGRMVADETGDIHVPLGAPQPGMTVTVRDPVTDSILPDGHVGEITISGPAVSDSSVSGRTSGPAPTGSGTRPNDWVRTGDIGGWYDCELFVLGRSKEILIRNGRNYAPEDLESALQEALPEVHSAAFQTDDGTIVVAFEASESKLHLNDDLLLLAARVTGAATGVMPDLVAAIPRGSITRTSSGKIQRLFLRDAWSAGQIEPVTSLDVARDIGRFLDALLSTNSGSEETVADWGFDSLQRARLFAALQSRYGVHLPLDTSIQLDAETLRGLLVAAAAPSTAGAPADVEGRPLHAGERQIWLHQFWNGIASAYNLSLAFVAGPDFDVESFVEDCRSLVAGLGMDRIRVQLGHQSEGAFVRADSEPVPVHRLPCTQAATQNLVKAISDPFDLADAPPFRLIIAPAPGGETAIALVTHHLILDFVSALDVATRLAQPGRPRVTGGGFAWGYVDPPDAAPEEAEPDVFDSLQLRPDFLVRAAQTVPAATIRRHLGPEEIGKLSALSGEAGTVYSVVLTAWSALLRMLSSQSRFAFHVSATLRRAAPGDSLGFLAGLVPVGVDRSTGTLSDLLADCRRVALSLAAGTGGRGIRVEGDSAPVAALHFNAEHDPNASDLAQLLFGASGPKRFRDADVEPIDADACAPRAALELSVLHTPNELDFAWRYDPARFDAGAMERRIRWFERILSQLGKRPATPLAALPELLAFDDGAGWCLEGARDPIGRLAVYKLFEQFGRDGEHPAIDDGVELLGYADLAGRVTALSNLITRTPPGSVVAIFAPRGAMHITAVLAALHANRPFVNIDPQHPADRNRTIVSHCRPTLILCDRSRCDAAAVLSRDVTTDVHCVEDLISVPYPEQVPPPARRSGDAPAYLMYTSGSTGAPKGVIVNHRGMTNHLMAKIEDLGMEPRDRFAQTGPTTFDIYVWQVVAPLMTGGAIVVFPDEEIYSLGFPRLLAAKRITLLQLVPAAIGALLDAIDADADQRLGLRWLSSTGDALPSDLIERWFAAMPGVPILNTYGATECSDDQCHLTITRPDDPPRGAVAALGHPIRNMRIVVVSDDGRTVPRGIAGEILIAGIGVGPGYLGNPRLTADVFRPDPWSSTDGARLYRSGDLGRINHDGALEFFTRLGGLMKVGGMRVERAEVESALRGLPGVRDSAVDMRTIEEGGVTHLVAWVVGMPDMTVDGAELRRALADRLPTAMLPSIWFEVPRLPTNTNGKIDRRTLRVPKEVGPALNDSGEQMTPLEQMVTEIYSNVLGRTIGPETRFLAAGGNSIDAIRIAGQLQERGLNCRPRDVLASLDPRALVQVLDVDPVPRNQHPRDRYVDYLAAMGDGVSLGGIEAVRELGPLQRHIVSDSLAADENAYVQHIRLPVIGTLDVPALKRAFTRLCQERRALRTTLDWMRLDVPVRVVSTLPLAGLEVVEVAGDRSTQVSDRIVAEGLSLDGPLVRAVLLRETTQKSMFVLTSHHAVVDGWSLGVLLERLLAIYFEETGSGPNAPALPADPDWEEPLITVGPGTAAFWRAHLAGSSGPARLAPLAASALPTMRTADICFGADGRTTEDIAIAAANAQVTIASFLHAAWAIVLGRFSERSDIVFGSVSSGRAGGQGIDTRAVGLFINTTPLRIVLVPDAPLSSIIRDVHTALVERQEHESMPLEAIRDECGLSGQLFDSALVIQNFPVDRKTVGLTAARAGLELGEIRFDDKTPLPLTLTCAQEETWRFVMEYDTARISAADTQALSDCFVAVLRNLCMHQDQNYASLALRLSDVHPSLAVQGDPPHNSLYAAFAEAARRDPEAPALLGVDTISYAEALETIRRLAGQLAKAGVGPGCTVGLVLARSERIPLAILATNALGAAFVLTDSEQGADLRAEVFEASRPTVILADDWTSATATAEGRGTEGVSVIAWPDVFHSPFAYDLPEPSADSYAYVAFTSGSTGKPKGVIVQNRALMHRLADWLSRFSLQPRMRHLSLARAPFDVLVGDVVRSLATGGALCIGDRKAAKDADAFVAEVTRHAINFVEITPQTARLIGSRFASDLKPPASLGTVVVGSDRWTASEHTEFQSRLPFGCYAIASYGVTEAVIDSTTYGEVDDSADDMPARFAGTSAIGTALPSVEILVVTRDGLDVPRGGRGELCIGGPLALGYLDDPRRTALRFRPDPTCDGGRVYATGDDVGVDAQGVVWMHGRLDDEVKIGGVRVNPSEVAAVLERHPDVRQAAVQGYVSADRAELVAWVRYKRGRTADAVGLRDWVATHWGAYAIPAHILEISAFPVTPNGKIDFAALPRPDPASEPGAAPTTTTERAVAEVWLYLFGKMPRDTQSDFFADGGDSILAVQLIAGLGRRGFVVGVRDVFVGRTLAGIAARIDAAAADTPCTGPNNNRDPYTPAQRWFIDQEFVHPDRWLMALRLRLTPETDFCRLEAALQSAAKHHPELGQRWPDGLRRPAVTDMTASLVAIEREADPAQADAATDRAFGSIRLATGPLVAAALIGGHKPELQLAAHHLVIDGVSWRIFLSDVTAAYRGETRAHVGFDGPSQLGPVFDAIALSNSIGQEQDFWTAQTAPVPDALRLTADELHRDARTETLQLDAPAWKVIQKAAVPSDVTSQELILAAVLEALFDAFETDALTIEMEAHGRDHPGLGEHAARVGWFTALFPLRVERKRGTASGFLAEAVRTLRRLPSGGIGAALVRRRRDLLGEEPQRHTNPSIAFNYLGEFDRAGHPGDPFEGIDGEVRASAIDPDNPLTHAIEIDAASLQSGLVLHMRTPSRLAPIVRRIASQVYAKLMEYYNSSSDPVLSVAEARCGCAPGTLADAIAATHFGPSEIEAIYPLTDLQHAVYVQSQIGEEDAPYIEQLCVTLGGTVPPDALEKAWQKLAARRAALRTRIVSRGLDQPVQIVTHTRGQQVSILELSADEDAAAAVERYAKTDRARGFSDTDILSRVCLIRKSDGGLVMVWTHHHAILDGWSASILLTELLEIYQGIQTGHVVKARPELPFRNYVKMLEALDQRSEKAFWTNAFRDWDINRQHSPMTRQWALRDWVMRGLDQRLVGAARRLGTTSAILIELAVAASLARRLGTADVVLGLTVSLRPTDDSGGADRTQSAVQADMEQRATAAHPASDDIAPMVGLCVNTVPIPIHVDEDGDLERTLLAIAELRGDYLAHAYSSLGQIADWIGAPRTDVMIDAMLVVENYPMRIDPTEAKAIEVQGHSFHSYADVPLSVVYVPGEATSLRLIWDQGVWADTAVSDLADDIGEALEALIHASPGQRLGEFFPAPEATPNFVF